LFKGLICFACPRLGGANLQIAMVIEPANEGK